MSKAHEICRWDRVTDGYNLWATDCGKEFQIIEDGDPKEHGFEFCCFCGGDLFVEPTTNAVSAAETTQATEPTK